MNTLNRRQLRPLLMVASLALAVSACGKGQNQPEGASQQMTVTVIERIDPFTFRADAGPAKTPIGSTPSGALTLRADEKTVIEPGGNGVFPSPGSFRDLQLASGTPVRVTIQLPAQSDGSYRLLAVAFDAR